MKNYYPLGSLVAKPMHFLFPFKYHYYHSFFLTLLCFTLSSWLPFNYATTPDVHPPLLADNVSAYKGMDIYNNSFMVASTIVTNTNDSGPGSLREAINCANLDPVMDYISFNIGGIGPHTINITSNLPAITDDGVTIDGTSQPGYVGSPIIIVDGGGVTSDAFVAFGDDFSFFGLKVSNFLGSGLSIVSADFAIVTDNIFTENGSFQVFLSDVTQSQFTDNSINVDENNIASPLDEIGIWLQGITTNNTFTNNVIAGANNVIEPLVFLLGPGVELNTFNSNYIGTNISSDDLGGAVGINILNASTNDFISNTIAYNDTGIYNDVNSQQNFFSANNFFCNIFFCHQYRTRR